MSKSKEIVKRLIELPEYARSRCVMLYWSCDNEVHTHDLVREALKEGKKVLLPRCDAETREISAHEVKNLSRDVEKGPFGIDQPGADTPEQTDLSEIEACVVPGIAFDGEGNRIGRGFGYYDRFLQKLNERTQKIGLGYGFQIVNKIYPTERDARLDKVVTETEFLVAHPSVMK